MTDLKQPGRTTPLPASPEEALLEKVANPHEGTAYLVRFTCPEFTSLCPLTGQPTMLIGGLTAGGTAA